MKTLITIIAITITYFSFCQNSNKKLFNKNFGIPIYYQNSNKNLIAIFVNDNFMGNSNNLETIDSRKVASVNVKKEDFTKNGFTYNGKIFIVFDPSYEYNFVLLDELITKHLNLDANPNIIQINENIVNQSYNEYMIDQNYILKIEVSNIKPTKNIEFNFIKIYTKTAENIKKANEIILKGKN